MAQYKFHNVYTGPRGSHLNHLTKYTLTHQRLSPEKSISIHPKATIEGRSKFEKDGSTPSD